MLPVYCDVESRRPAIEGATVDGCALLEQVVDDLGRADRDSGDEGALVVDARAEVRDWRACLDQQSHEAHIAGACSADERATAHGEPEARLKALGGRPVLRCRGERRITLEQASEGVGVMRADRVEEKDRVAKRVGARWAARDESVSNHGEQLLQSGAGRPPALLGGGDRDAEEGRDLRIREAREVVERDDAALALG